jgi:hypothetical protein
LVPGSGFSVGAQPNDVIAADVDGDGDIDIVAANRGGARTKAPFGLSLLLNGGSAAFEAPRGLAAGQRAFSVAAADLDGDARSDLLFTEDFANRVTILRQADPGSFNEAARIPVEGAPHHLAAANLDGDGRLDLAVGSYSTRGLTVFWGGAKPLP